MNRNRQIHLSAALLVIATVLMTIASTRLVADTSTCGGAMTTLPFTDVSGSNIFFCSIASAYFTGLTNGTSATTYSPSDSVTREQTFGSHSMARISSRASEAMEHCYPQ
jgi:hypothetical protein